MDISRVLTRAWEITWRWKVLWVLGFLASLGSGTGGGANSGYRFSNNGNIGNGNFPNLQMPAGAEGLIIALGCLAVIIGIVLWVVGTIARGGLIAGVAQVEDEGSTSLGRAWAVGQSRFWTLIGIGILAAIPILVVILAGVIGVIAFLVPVAATSGGSERAIGNAVLGALACVVPCICVLVLVSVVLSQIRIYAERAAILEGMGWIDAFRRGWQVLRDHIGPTLGLWLIFLVIGLIIGAIALAIALPIVLPLVALFNVPQQQSPTWLFLLPICGLGAAGILIAAVIGSVVDTFTSATWTLAYRSLTAGPAIIPPAAPSIPPAVEG